MLKQRVDYVFYCVGVTEENIDFPTLRAAQRELDEHIGLGEKKYGVREAGFTAEKRFVVEGRLLCASKSAQECLFALLKKEIKRVYPMCTVVHTDRMSVKKVNV